MLKISKLTKIEYNINGIGVITPIIYPFPSILYNEKKIKLVPKLKGINQLGSIKYLHNGAHYTRYEYVLLQIMLINFVKNNSKWGLGSKFNFSSVGITENLNYLEKVTGAEILQLIVLFSNQGHFKDTFASNKVWFHLLYTNKYNLKDDLKKGLTKEGKKLLDKLISNSDYQKIQWINTLFILSRSEKYEDYRIICEHLLNDILSEDGNKWGKWTDIYSKIRKVSYVVLDSHFSGIPISINLQNVLFNETFFIDELSKSRSGLMGTFDRVNDLLEDTLYLENNALLVGTFRSTLIYDDIKKFIASNENSSITKVSKLLSNTDHSPFFKEHEISDDELIWNFDKNLSLTFPIKNKKGFPKDVFQNEIDAQKKIGTNCNLAFNFSPDFSKYRTVYSINKFTENKKLLDLCLNIIGNALDNYFCYKDHSYESVDNGPFKEVAVKKFITYLFRNILKEDYYCEFDYSKDLTPFFIGKGVKNVSKEVNHYIKEFQKRNPLEKDALHELNTAKKALNSITYRGTVLVFLGSLKFIDSNKKPVCELDGIIFTPKNSEIFLRVIEAKNIGKVSSGNIASRQLKKKFSPLLAPWISKKNEIEAIDGCGAQLKMMRKCGFDQ